MNPVLKRLALWALGLTAVVVAALAGIYLAMTARFYPDPPPADYPAPADVLEAQRQDLDYFRRLLAMDRAFTPEARQRAAARLDEMDSAAEPLPPGRFRVALMQIAALADNGHTFLHPDDARGGLPALLPLRLSLFSDGIYVLQAPPEHADLLATRVTAIDGQPIETVLGRLDSLRGGTAAFRRHRSAQVIRAIDYLHGLGISSHPRRSTWTFETREGATIERTLEADRPDPSVPVPDTWRVRSPEPVPGDPRQWSVVTPEPALPVTHRAANRAFRELPVPDATSCVTLVQLRSNADAGGDRISDFLARARSSLEARRPCSVILDLRQNGGGDYTTTASFAAALPELVADDGRVYVLTGPRTFSAGITTAVFTRQADPQRVVLLGEPVGDRLAFWSEGTSGCLPNAPLCFRYATGRHDYQQPCRDWKTCFWLNWLYPARTDTLGPDEVITTSFRDYLDGRDPVFERALELAHASAERF